MRYRLELLSNDEIVVHNEETGLILGSAIPHFAPCRDNPNRQTVLGCTVFNNAGEKLATISNATVPNPLGVAAVAVANHEHHYNYAGFRARASEQRRPNRIEYLLGNLLADLSAEIGCGIVECHAGALKAETKERAAALIAELHAIWYASRFGSFDDQDRGVNDPYFSSAMPSGPRMSFAQSAQHYGMNELRRRFPNIHDPSLGKMLSWPLELLTHLLSRVSPAAPG